MLLGQRVLYCLHSQCPLDQGDCTHCRRVLYTDVIELMSETLLYMQRERERERIREKRGERERDKQIDEYTVACMFCFFVANIYLVWF